VHLEGLLREFLASSGSGRSVEEGSARGVEALNR